MKDFQVGEYTVGFRREKLTDYSRAYGERFRPVELFIWYPATATALSPLNFSDYFLPAISAIKGIGSAPLNFDSLLVAEIKKMNLSGALEPALSKLKKLKTLAHDGTAIVAGSFPLIIFAPGGNTSGQFHSVICEYLASHGYIVVSIPSLGPAEGQPWPFDQTGLNMHIDDMEFAINHLAHSVIKFDIEKICLIAWSVGGVSQGIYSMKNPNIDMLVSMDSGLGRTYGIEMIRESPYFSYRKLTVPYLHFTGKQPELYKVEKNLEFYDSIVSPVKYSMAIEAFAHQHFASQIGLIPELISEKGSPTIIQSYSELCRIILIFINTYLKRSMPEKEWINLIEAIRK